MNIVATNLADVLIIEPKVFGDERGYFYESFNAKSFAAQTGLTLNFVQDNHSKSAHGVLRGLHYQITQAQGKLVRVTSGAVFDVAVDLRKNSATFGQWTGHILSEENKLQMWVPAGFAHGFLVLSESAEFLYKTTDYWAPEHERCIAWDDASIAIDWPLDQLQHAPTLSGKDQQGKAFADAEVYL